MVVAFGGELIRDSTHVKLSYRTSDRRLYCVDSMLVQLLFKRAVGLFINNIAVLRCVCCNVTVSRHRLLLAPETAEPKDEVTLEIEEVRQAET